MIHLKSIPRFSLPARLTCIDLISRYESSNAKCEAVRHAISVVSSYLLNPDAIVSENELQESISILEKLYC
jgi:hypothetical protein